MPPEGRETLRAIKQAGRSPTPRDGVVFGNYERVLPKHPRGYYREYTVKTPGARNRGARASCAGNRSSAITLLTIPNLQTYSE